MPNTPSLQTFYDLSLDAYNYTPTTNVDGFSATSDNVYSITTGLVDHVYINSSTNQMVISFQGTNKSSPTLLTELTDDAFLGVNLQPEAFGLAEQFVNNLLSVNPQYNSPGSIFVTGHSLDV